MFWDLICFQPVCMYEGFKFFVVGASSYFIGIIWPYCCNVNRTIPRIVKIGCTGTLVV